MQDLSDELEALPHLSTGELLARYAELFGQPARTRNKAFLVRKVAWRLQARAFSTAPNMSSSGFTTSSSLTSPMTAGGDP